MARQAYQEQLTEIYSKNADVLIEAEKNKIGLRDAEGKLAVAQKAQNDEFERQNRLYQEANQKVQDYFVETGLVTDASMWLGETTDELNRKLEQNAQAVFAAQDEVGAYQKAIEKDNEALEAAQDEIALAEEAVQDLTSASALPSAKEPIRSLRSSISPVLSRRLARFSLYVCQCVICPWRLVLMLGAEVAMMPIGSKIGTALTKTKNLPLNGFFRLSLCGGFQNQLIF